MSLSCPKIIPKLVSRPPDAVSKLFQSYLKVMQRFSQSFQKLSWSFLEVALKMFSRCPKNFPKLTQNCFICVQRLSMLFLGCAIHISFEICVSHRLQTSSTSLRSTSKIQVLSKFSNDHWLSLTPNQIVDTETALLNIWWIFFDRVRRSFSSCNDRRCWGRNWQKWIEGTWSDTLTKR